MGTATINRFFGLHVWLMPAALVGLVGAHLAIFRHNGSAGPVVDDPRKLKVGRFWPDQMFMDGAASFIVFVIIMLLATFLPPFLDEKADPTKFFVPYPAWYFLSLFGLLALFPPEFKIAGLSISTELISTIAIPTLFLLVVLAIPWLDRSTTRSFSSAKGSSGERRSSSSRSWPIDFRPGPNDGETGGRAAVDERSPNGRGHASAVAARRRCGRGAGHRQRCEGLPAPTVPPVTARTDRANRGVPAARQELDVVTGDPNKVIGIVTGGLHGSIVVNGGTYKGVMPPWKGTLSNGDIASCDHPTSVRIPSATVASAVTEKQVGWI